ncbi:uncharacterized protein [Antedon mediterranea]
MGKAKQKNQPGGKLKTGSGKVKGPTMKVFKVSHHKVVKAQQLKAKSVSTNLKRLNHQNKNKVKSNNDTFKELQQSIAEKKKDKQKKVATQLKSTQEPINMDDTVEGFAKL